MTEASITIIVVDASIVLWHKMLCTTGHFMSFRVEFCRIEAKLLLCEGMYYLYTTNVEMAGPEKPNNKESMGRKESYEKSGK